MTKRNATYIELRQSLLKPPWNKKDHFSVMPSTDNCAEAYLRPPKLVPLTIYFSREAYFGSQGWMLHPLDGIKIPKLAKLLNLPTITTETPLLFGELTEDEDYDSEQDEPSDGTKIYGYETSVVGYTFDMTASSAYFTHFMTIARYDDVNITKGGTQLDPSQPWLYTELANFGHDFTGEDQQILRAISAVDPQSHSYWEFTLYPIGYCQPKKAGNSHYEITDDKGVVHSANETIDDLFEPMQQATLNLYEEAYAEAQKRAHIAAQDFERVAQEHVHTLEELCQTAHARMEQVRQTPGFEKVDSFFQIHADNLHIQRGNGALYTPEKLSSLLSQLERRAQRYRSFSSAMALLRPRIEAAYGELDTTNTDYAEVTFPLHAFGTQDQGKETQRFQYSIVGYTKLQKWLLLQEGLITEAEQWLKENKRDTKSQS